jgi:hypothetical protein
LPDRNRAPTHPCSLVARAECCNPPDITKGIHDSRLPRLIRLVGRFRDRRGAAVERASVSGVDVGDVDVHEGTRGLQFWRKGSGVHDDDRITDPCFHVLGRKMRLWREWLQHPTMDAYWARIQFTPQEFQRIDICPRDTLLLNSRDARPR